MRVPLAVVGLNELDIENAVKVFRSGVLTMGEKVARFEIVMSEYLRVNHSIVVNSGSSANLLIFESPLRQLNGNPKLKIRDGVLGANHDYSEEQSEDLTQAPSMIRRTK